MSAKKIIIIDGYNVIHCDRSFRRHLDKDLLTARSALINYCADWMSLRKDVWLFYVVFDGDSSVEGMSLPARRDVRVLYTESGETADDRILDIVRERSEDANPAVVSDDREVMRGAGRYGAEVMSVAEFCGVLDKKKKKMRNSVKQYGKSGGKVSPREEADITKDLMREWGVEGEGRE